MLYTSLWAEIIVFVSCLRSSWSFRVGMNVFLDRKKQKQKQKNRKLLITGENINDAAKKEREREKTPGGG